MYFFGFRRRESVIRILDDPENLSTQIVLCQADGKRSVIVHTHSNSTVYLVNQKAVFEQHLTALTYLGRI